MTTPEHEYDDVRGPLPHDGDPGAHRVLLVGAGAGTRSRVVRRLRRAGLECRSVTDLDRAMTVLDEQPHDAVLVWAGQLWSDVDRAASVQPELEPLVAVAGAAGVVVMLDAPSFPAAVGAMRHGATDVIDLSRELDDVAERTLAAAAEAARVGRTKREHEQLSAVCHELSIARDAVSDQVDTLCDELASAYRDVAAQLEEVTMATEFRTLLRQELDVEDLLRTALEYMLTRTGPTNAAVYLPDEDGGHTLGAYVNFDCPRTSIGHLLDRLGEAVFPQMAGEPGLVAFEDAPTFLRWAGVEGEGLEDQQVVAFACYEDGECLAVFVLFRSLEVPFNDAVALQLDTMRSIFAEQLAKVIWVHHRARAQWPDEAEDIADDDDFSFGFEGGLAA